MCQLQNSIKYLGYVRIQKTNIYSKALWSNNTYMYAVVISTSRVVPAITLSFPHTKSLIIMGILIATVNMRITPFNPRFHFLFWY